MVKRQKINKNKESSAHKGGPGRYKHKRRTGNVSYAAPFNTQPMNRKHQSRNDKVEFLRSKGIKGQAASKLAKSGKKLSKVVSKQRKFKGSGGGGAGSNNGWRKFKVKLPEHVPQACNTPWYGYETNGKAASTTKRNKNLDENDIGTTNHILPSSYYSLPKSSISALQNEIEAFVQYIRLTPQEIAARKSVINHVTELSHNLWHQDVKIQPFGSFATLNVCTFQSDIDLALWNVVPTENVDDGFCNNDSEKEYVFGEESGVVMSENSLSRTMQALKNENPHQKGKKDRINEWKKILEEVDLANASSSPSPSPSPSKDPHTKSKKKFATKPKPDADGKQSSEKPPPFDFVIDRKGIPELGGEINEEESTSAARSNQKQEEVIVIDDSDDGDDDDSVDKMNVFHQRQHAAELGISNVKDDQVIHIDSSDDSNDSDNLAQVTRRTRSHGTNVNDTCDYSDEDEIDDSNYVNKRGPVARRTRSHNAHLFAKRDNIYSDENSCSSEASSYDGFELNISNVGQPRKTANTIGPTGNIRTKVVNALSLMGKRLRKSPFAQNLQVRRNARVPIICLTTRYGFDADVALAGHNGTDTSHYVRKLVEKFDSFATVVLFLKILLQQADLDKPFTGGLGSYKLYVLVANHYNTHKFLGGGDTATEMLLSFLYRYSTPSKSRNKARTHLNKSFTITSEGGEADLSPVSVQHCIDFFQLCFQRIMDILAQHETNKKSLVASLIDMMKVKRERSFVLNQSKAFKTDSDQIPHNHPGKISVGGRVNHAFSKSSTNSASNGDTKPSVIIRPGSERKKDFKKEEGAQAKTKALRKSAKRSSRGALIPKRRIDVEMKLDGMDALIQRGAKRRTNKKKQKRDAAVRDFVMKQIS